MKALILLFAFAIAAHGQSIDNALSVKQFKGNDVGTKLANAMATCNPDPTIACYLVLDPSLGSYAPGVTPTLCPNCVLRDFRLSYSSGGSLQSISITNPGKGYAGTEPVTISGCSGSGATAHITVGQMPPALINSIVVDTAGSGYVCPPSVVIGVPTNTNLSRYGLTLTQATAVAYISGGTVTAGATFPGVVSDGASGIQVNGDVRAANVIAPIQELHATSLKSTLTKVAEIALNQGGYSGYTNQAQLTVVIGGDSTGSFHSGEVYCTLVAEYGWAGYFVNSPIGATLVTKGFNCPTIMPTYTLSGGAYLIDGSTYPYDFSHFPAGWGYVLPNGGCIAETPSAVFMASTNESAFYVQEPGAGTLTVSTQNGTGGWVDETPIVANGTLAGKLWTKTVSSGPYSLKACASGGTVNLWGFGQVNTAANGVIGVQAARGGMSLPDNVSTPSAIITPWYAAINPDLVIFEMKSNGVTATDHSCNQATTAAPTVFQPYSYWWNLWVGNWLTANAYADLVPIGGYDVGIANDPDGCIAKHNEVYRAWAQANQQPYFDLYSQVPNTVQRTLGWIDTSVHQTAIGQVAEGNLLVQYLGIMQWPVGLATKDVSVTNVTSTNITGTNVTATNMFSNNYSGTNNTYYSSPAGKVTYLGATGTGGRWKIDGNGHFLAQGAYNVITTGTVQGVMKANDGTAGYTGACGAGIALTVKNGLIVSCP